MPKMALCTTVEEVDSGKPPEQWILTLQDRAVVDDKTRLDPNIQQFIPYVVLRWICEVSGHFYYLTYLRGDAGTEEGLRGKLSIGTGGHPDTMPDSLDLIDHLVLETLREVREEVGIWLNPEKVMAAISKTFKTKAFIRRTETPVDTVHLGIPIIYDLSTLDRNTITVSARERGIIENIQWHHRKQLQESKTFERLETWSKHLVSSDEYLKG